MLLLLLTVGMTYVVLQRTGVSQLSLGSGNHLGILVGMDIHDAYLVVSGDGFSMALHEKPEHGIVSVRIPPRQKYYM